MAESCSLTNPLAVLQAIRLKVVEASPDAKIVINDQQIIVDFNAKAEFMFGWDRTEVLGKPIEFLLPDSLADAHKKHVANYLAEPGTREMGAGRALKGLKRNGNEFSVQIKLAPMVIPGAGVHVLAVVRATHPNGD